MKNICLNTVKSLDSGHLKKIMHVTNKKIFFLNGSILSLGVHYGYFTTKSLCGRLGV